ncbi:MAG: thiolase family protein, partial [Roseovarius sp.]
VGGLTIDRQCAGGLDAVLLAVALVEAGRHEMILAGGAESYSRRPLRARIPPGGGAAEPYDQAPFTPWPERDPGMAEAADALARELGIAQAEQDAWAVESHRKAQALPEARRAAEIVPLAGLEADAFTRALTPRLCARAPRVTGSITAANMAVAADGAGLVLVVSERAARRLNTPGLALLGRASLGGDPERPGLAPVAAIGAALTEASLAPSDMSAAEIMEAFAVQAIACQRGAGLPEEIVNLAGGALARGHPIGASGAVLAVSLFHQLRHDGGPGLAAIAAAGGLGTALVAEMR